MTEVLYICLWYKDKKRTWSGTAWSLRQAMEPYLQVQDLALSDPLYRKILRRLQRKKGLPPGRSCGTGCGCRGDMLRGDIGTGQTKNACVSVWRLASGAHLAFYLYQDLSISAILWLQREDPVGYRYCEYDQVPQKTLERRAARQLEQYRQSEGVFTMSRWLSEFLIRECGLPREKVHAVGGGINVDAAGIRPGSKEGRRILFVGRNFVRKGGPLVVQAFTILRKNICGQRSCIWRGQRSRTSGTLCGRGRSG